MSNSQVAAYVQPDGGEIAEREPPMANTGFVGWVRENLFGNLTDTIITLILAFLLLWAGWSSLSGMFLRANTAGFTQGEGTLARLVADLHSNLDVAEAREARSDQDAEAVIAEQERDLAELARLASLINLDELEIETLQSFKLRGLQQRVLPATFLEKLNIAQSKLPLSRVIELELARQQMIDPRQTSLPDPSVFSLNDAERERLRQGSLPWARGSDAEKALFQETLAEARDILVQTQSGESGKVYLPLDEVRAEVMALLSGLNLEGQSVSASDLLERPTRPASQFNAMVDTVVGAPITTIPESRIQKIRKDFLLPSTIDALKLSMVRDQVQADNPNLSGRALTEALSAAAATITDGSLFLNREMPAGFEDPLPANLIAALDEMEFWDSAQLIANPRTVLNAAPAQNEEAATSDGTLDPNSATSSDGLNAYQKVPLVIAALDQSSAPTGLYAETVRELTAAYEAENIAGMRAALAGLDPLIDWAESNNGSNWVVLRNFERGTDNNWNRMLIGSYTANKVWHLFDKDAEGWKLNDKVWRIWAVTFGLIIAVLPLVVPAARSLPFYIFSGIYPLFLLFMLGGLAIRFYGFQGAGEDAGLLATLYSDLGKVIQAGLMLLLILVAWLVRTRTAFGKTAGPALMVILVLATGYFVIMIRGSVINNDAAQKNILVQTNFTGLLTADHPLGEELDPAPIQAQIDALNEQSNAEGLSREQVIKLRTQANELRPDLAAATSAKREFENVVAAGEGTFVILPYRTSLEWGGLLVTMVLGVLGMAASLPIGIVLAFGRQSTLPIVRWFSTGLIEITRGVPLIALLLVVTFVLPKLLPADADYPKLFLVFLAICLFGGVYQAEVIRGGLQSLPRGQYEASQAMGLTFWQESRLITLPQALKAVIPAIVNTFIGLFKDTTLVIVVGIVDLLTIVEFQITAENAWNRTKPEALLVVSLIFFVLMFFLSRYSIWLEKRLATGHR